jgi:hypothetical protein
MAYSLDPTANYNYKLFRENISLMIEMCDEKERIKSLSTREKVQYILRAYSNHLYFNFYAYYFNKKEYNIYQYNRELYQFLKKLEEESRQN